MIPVVAAVVSALAQRGMSILASAIEARGKEFIEEKIGVKIPDSTNGLTEPVLLELKRAEMAHEEFLVAAANKRAEIEAAAEAAENSEVTERWKSDMTSDSWLSKNVRPGVLAWWTVAVTVMAFCSEWVKVDAPWVDVIKYSYITVLGTYFASRGVQHGLKIWKG